MALDDRDYMRDRTRRRENYTEKAGFRRSMAGENDYRYNPKQFRSTPVSVDADPTFWGALWRFVLICLAVYGALSAARDIHTWAERKKQLTAPPVQPYQPTAKEAAWARYYQPPEYCAYATDQARQHCLAERAAARRRFEQLYAAGQL